jgi:hypothetical protein
VPPRRSNWPSSALYACRYRPVQPPARGSQICRIGWAAYLRMRRRVAARRNTMHGWLSAPRKRRDRKHSSCSLNSRPPKASLPRQPSRENLRRLRARVWIGSRPDTHSNDPIRRIVQRSIEVRSPRSLLPSLLRHPSREFRRCEAGIGARFPT